ncbi:MAG: histidinol-phosphatase [Lachnospiraceae bacterium]|nr:histidinol-phosphatase [Lachnospiraceae bacterium]
MIDFHAHVLPGLDDGSSSIEESIEMLRLSFREGVRTIVATPHFYAHKEAPEHFLERRRKSWEQLAPQLPDDAPEIYLGAEVYYYTGISNTEDLPRLCVGEGRTLLLEMPFHKWSERMVEEVTDIAQDTDITVLLAHIDRYLASQDAETWEELAENGVLFQMNASAFLNGWLARRRALKLLQEGKIAVLGSDCHNMGERKPNLGEALDVIRKKSGVRTVHALTENAERLLISGQKAT